jgi:hypothetical protein
MDTIKVEEALTLEDELDDLICVAYTKLTNTALYNAFSLNQETNQICGDKIFLKDFFSSS